MSKNIITPEFRLSYPAVFAPKYNKMSKKDEYSIVMLIPKNSPELAAFGAAYQQAITDRWGANPPVFKNTLFKDGDSKEYGWTKEKKNPDGTIVPSQPKLGCAGHFIVRATGKTAVGVWNQATNSYMTDPQQLYGGCYCKAYVNFFTYPKKGEVEANPGVSIEYTALLKVRDGEPFGAGPVDAAKVFADIASLPTAGVPVSPVAPAAAAPAGIPTGAVQATPAAIAAFLG